MGEDKAERIAVPAMPRPAAYVCCILNFLIPGFGTICAGFSSFCCSKNEDIGLAGRFSSCLLGFGIGVAQMCACLLCLVGWVWACIWGVYFINMSERFYPDSQVAPHSSAVVVTNQPTQPISPPPYPYPGPGAGTVPVKAA